MTNTDALVEAARRRRNLPAPQERQRIREAAGLSREEVAQVLAVTPGAIGYWERGDRSPSRAHVDAYADLLARLRAEVGA